MEGDGGTSSHRQNTEGLVDSHRGSTALGEASQGWQRRSAEGRVPGTQQAGAQLHPPLPEAKSLGTLPAGSSSSPPNVPHPAPPATLTERL